LELTEIFMSTMYIITKTGIFVIDHTTASQAILQRIEGAIASGNATAYVVDTANVVADSHIVTAYGDASTTLDLARDAMSQNYNNLVRDSFAAVLGTLAGLLALPAGPAAALAADYETSERFSEAYDGVSEWSANQDWSPLFDWLDSLPGQLEEFQGDLESGFLRFALGLSEFLDGIGEAVDDLFNSAFNFIRRSDPLTLDLDGDGIETVGASSTNPILFDHDGDGIRTGTGWVNSDDGLLVLDRNSNGTIDNGGELFGDSTTLSGGGLAADGFAALADMDSNADGVVNSSDTRFANLRVWRDLNQDGISQSGELFTLASLGIASINVAHTNVSTNLGNGNTLTATGSFTRTDGSTSTVGGTNLGDANLVEDTFHREFTDTIPLAPGVSDLPNMQGSGKVRDLWEAANEDSFQFVQAA
jgi:hypothetical protein